MEITERKSIKIILVRHGETEWNRLHIFQGRSDIELNRKGNIQAQALALALQNENMTAIFSSPLTRAKETALHIHRFHSTVPLIENSGLIEMNLGDFEGMKGSQWKEQYKDFRKQWEQNPGTLAMPNGESLYGVQQRSVKALNTIINMYSPGDTLLICSHNFVIVSLLCFASGTALDNFRKLRQDTASLNIIYKDELGFAVERVNDCRHLKELPVG